MARALASLLRLLRYRFLLIAGLFPYCLGAAVAFYRQGQFDLGLFLFGLLGIFFALVGVEAFNEFFDFQLGSDRVFQLEAKAVTHKTFFIGIFAFFLAFCVAVFLTYKLGIAVIIFAFSGFFAAFFYLGPPLKLTYRGFGEIIIALAYGPLMMLGSYYVQSQRIDTLPFMISLIPAGLLFCVSIMNEVPDYFQDKLVGKRNICVRIGQKRTVKLYGSILILFYLSLLTGLLLGKFPGFVGFIFIFSPVGLLSYIIGIRTCDNPRLFLPAIRYTIIHYLIVVAIFTFGYIFAVAR